MSLYNELKRRNVIRVAVAYVAGAWLLIQVAETLFPVYGLSDMAIRTVVAALGVGFIPALVLAWAFELTPDGLKKDPGEEVDAGLAPQTHKNFDRLIMAVLAIGLGFFTFDKFVLDPARDAAMVESATKQGRAEAMIESFGDRSIAVLAFEDLSPEGDQEYFSDGIAEELLNLLARVPELRVISRSSAFSYKGSDTAIPTIARELNVAHVLEGSVRKSGDRVRITAQLIDARSDTHIWSETYERTLDDIFAIQDEIAETMLEQLKITLLGSAPKSRRVDPVAYTKYLEALHVLDYGEASQERRSIVALELLEDALQLQPDFADAWTGVARAYVTLRFWADPSARSENARLAIAAIDRALEIDPDNAIALAQKGFVIAEYDEDFAAAAPYFERALGLDHKDPQVLRSALSYSSTIRRTDITSQLGEISTVYNPLCSICNYYLTISYVYLEDFDRAERSLQRYMQLRPGGHHSLGMIKLYQGDLERALEQFEYPGSNDFDRAHGRLLVRIKTGQLEGIESEIAAYAQEWGKDWAWRVAELYAQIGDFDNSFAWLERLANDSSARLMGRSLQLPLLKPLHSDPRWTEMQERFHIAPHQLARIRFDPKLPTDYNSY